ncbi:hypothetical protein GCM10010978_22040 [Compostibacillus humi]|uniref:Uncharacterized protein n=1 Tax=Compostibacillus humi TaxID=1245525 RepID=A0A8J2X9D1_9BACI|nr:hypothetical protein [Compostibacillus humi]GFZ80509.1 hypothetical protein GCM10010978_22040 [Compostibacillus humi]HLT54669.1 hypothetical protein [Bacillota bacterium]
MNSVVLKDIKVMTGFGIALLLGVIAIFLALKDSETWVVFTVLGLVITGLSVFRADRLYKGKGK